MEGMAALDVTPAGVVLAGVEARAVVLGTIESGGEGHFQGNTGEGALLATFLLPV